MMADTKRQVPNLRFKGFTDNWEQRKLGEFGKATGGTSIESEFSSSGTYKVISIGSYSETHVYNDQGIRAKNSEKTHKRILNKNDLTMILNDKTASGRIIGSVLLIPCNNTFVYNQRTERIEPNISQFSPMFLYHYLNAPIVRQKIISNAQGNTQIYVNWSSISKVEYYLPRLNEQNKIGELLKNVSNLISLQQRKLVLLKQLKKGLLQKMFADKDSKQPVLRFKDFHDDWEQRKLGEVATFINGRAYKQNELLDSGKYKVLRVGNFYTNDSWYYSNLELADKYYIDEGDLVYTWSATFGPHIWNGEKVIYHYHIWKIELSKFLDRDFTLQILEADKAKLLANTNGSTMIHVTKKDMESKVISLPNIEEQKKIGSYLMKFDSLITLHQRKQNHLKLLKKSLLQQMFM